MRASSVHLVSICFSVVQEVCLLVLQRFSEEAYTTEVVHYFLYLAALLALQLDSSASPLPIGFLYSGPSRHHF